ncbi:MAG: helix-turn-helix domain-containing protein [Planctomycetia bacterium]|nr:helix-turn-helix domain-containing protein [Planctomycetia bacterium]
MSNSSYPNMPAIHETIAAAVPATGPQEQRRYHRIAEVRKSQGMSLTWCAKRLGISTQVARLQEQPTTDLTIAQLNAWREVLDVPLAEILEHWGIENDPIRNRALLLKTMKTARQIQKTAQEIRIKRMANTLVDQLITLMPELEFVAPWPDIGQSHEDRGFGQALYRSFGTEMPGLE